ncbi:restriction endonuclease [Paenibacillus sp. Y5S-9]|uniref:restriction endonuclease n=1 Tax=Paenibacillus sp. Y5S-9 TaxID=3122489 RepID=UPI0030D0C97E
MDGVQFEHYLGQLFRSQGYKAEVTKAAGDLVAELIMTKDGKRIVLQAKRYKKNVDLNNRDELIEMLLIMKEKLSAFKKTGSVKTSA